MPELKIATKKVIEQMFDEAAPIYNRIGPSIFTQFGEHLVRQIPIAPNAHVLDIATGSGAVLLPVGRKLGPEGHGTGIDLSAKLLHEAEQAVQSEGLPHIELRKMDAEQLHFPDRSFDVVTCAFAIFLFPDQKAALEEMHRVCKPGGYLAVSVFGKSTPPFHPAISILMQQFAAYQVGVQMPHPIAFSADELKELLSLNGFNPVQISNEVYDFVYSSLDEAWALALTMGPRVTIMAMDDKTREKFKDEYLSKLQPLMRPDGLHMSVSVVYALALR